MKNKCKIRAMMSYPMLSHDELKCLALYILTGLALHTGSKMVSILYNFVSGSGCSRLLHSAPSSCVSHFFFPVVPTSIGALKANIRCVFLLFQLYSHNSFLWNYTHPG